MITNLSDKPFACDAKNCFMTFTNEDHLNSHKKKHSMSFDLELNAKNNEAADQTPTPTSFFRNCEEVGLFQDLQNVNPFEETFKKALENSENKLGSLSNASNEDTLHTPHIFPNVEEPLHDNILDISNSEQLIVNLIEIQEVNEVSSQNVVEKQADLRNKLKVALMKKDKLKHDRNEENNPNFGTIIKVENKINDNKQIKSTNNTSDKSIERIREINRAAQMKCRVKKKRQMDKMMTELFTLRKENSELKKENARLKKSNVTLWKTLEDLGEPSESIMDKVKDCLLDISMEDTTPPVKTTLKKLPLIVPASPIVTPKSTPAPLIFNLVPVQMVNTNALNGVPPLASSISSDVKRQKIIPRILRKT